MQDETVAKLEELAGLLEKKIITREEYDVLKKRLLAPLPPADLSSGRAPSVQARPEEISSPSSPSPSIKKPSKNLTRKLLVAITLVVAGTAILFFVGKSRLDDVRTKEEVVEVKDETAQVPQENTAAPSPSNTEIADVNEEKTDTGKAQDVELTSTAQFPSAGQISASSVNMRSGHSILAQRIATLPRGQNVTVLDSWVADSEQEGILKKDLYTEVDGKTKTLGKGKAVSLVQYDASQGKYLVSLQEKSGTISGWTSEENVKSLKGALWYKVSTPSGTTGWVLGEFVSTRR